LETFLASSVLEDVSTLEDEASVDEIKATYEELRKQLDRR
jgi:hypothetical protein